MSDVEDGILDQLECPICYEFFREPKILHGCGHTVCKSCIDRMIEASTSKKTIVCPECRVKTTLPAGGLKTNYRLASVAEKVQVAHARGPCAVCKRRISEENFFECVTCKERTPNAAAAAQINQMCSICALEHHAGHYIVKSKDKIAPEVLAEIPTSSNVEFVAVSPRILPPPPVSAFRLWKKQNADRIRTPGMCEGELSAKARAEWANLEDKSKWEEMARMDKARYERQMNEIKAHQPPPAAVPRDAANTANNGECSPEKRGRLSNVAIIA